jgi:hypothetical protein
VTYDLITIYYEDHGGIAYNLTISKQGYRASKDTFEQLKSFVELLKSQVPASNRVYNPQTKVWTIEKQIFDTHLLKLMTMLNIKHLVGNPNSARDSRYATEAPKIDPNNFFYNTTPAPQVQTRESISESLAKLLGWSIVELSQPIDQLKKLYRRKALELHPDRNNGDGSKMSELNSLWSVFNAQC